VGNFWSDRELRNRYYHDEYFVVLTKGGVPATRGLPWRKDADVAWDVPTAENLWALAARFREHDHLFSHAAYAIRRKSNPADGTP
jgi:hypothetical protein